MLSLVGFCMAKTRSYFACFNINCIFISFTLME